MIAQGVDQCRALEHALQAAPVATRQGERGRRLQVCTVVLEQSLAPLLDPGPVHIGTGRVIQFGQLFIQRDKIGASGRIAAHAYVHLEKNAHRDTHC